MLLNGRFVRCVRSLSGSGDGGDYAAQMDRRQKKVGLNAADRIDKDRIDKDRIDKDRIDKDQRKYSNKA